MTCRELNLCVGRDRGYRALMGRMLPRVMGLWLICAAALLLPAVAQAAPTGIVAGWHSPLRDDVEDRDKVEMTLTIWANPDGVPLQKARATLGGKTFGPADFANRGCDGLCPAEAKLAIDAKGLPFGQQELVVTVVDERGEYVLERRTITIEPMPVFNKTVVVQVGSGKIEPPSSPPGGPVDPETGPTCRSPRLSMRLADTPLRFRRGVPVLKRGKTYRYKGKLSCRINGKRKPAPRGMGVQVRNRLRAGWTVVKPSVEVRKAGEIVARLAYRSSRTIIFRVRGARGELVTVRIPIRVVRR